MDKPTPRIEIDSLKIAHNAKTLAAFYGSKGISITGVTKGVCGHPAIASLLLESGINTLADSKIANIRRMRDAGITARFILLRTPAPSQIEEVVRYADISLNTELSVIEALSECARKSGGQHRIILMVDLGDLREGILPQDLDDVVSKVIRYDGVSLAGLGANLACFGGVKPDEDKMRTLSCLVERVEKRFGFSLEIVSGGNSANYSWFAAAKDVGRINNLRVGESLFLGRETLFRNPIPGLYTDAFTLVAEVIESKIKPSLPDGEPCQNSSAHIPSFKDRGMIQRILLNIGYQDVHVSGLSPRIEMNMNNHNRNRLSRRNPAPGGTDSDVSRRSPAPGGTKADNHSLTPDCMDVEILGATSDHVILDAKGGDLRPGDEVVFDLSYKALSLAMASPYVEKIFVS